MRQLLESIDVHGAVGWADKAAELGWSDQAHLIRDFKRHRGPPSEYVARNVRPTTQTSQLNQLGVTADYVYECEPEGGGTRVSLVADCRMTGPVKLLGPVIRSAIRKADGKQLDTFAATFPPG